MRILTPLGPLCRRLMTCHEGRGGNGISLGREGTVTEARTFGIVRTSAPEDNNLPLQTRMVSVRFSSSLENCKLISDHTYGPVGLPPTVATYQGPPDRQRNPSMPVPVTAQYGSLHIPEGYIPPSVNPPVVPQDVTSPTTDSDYWRGAAHSQHPRRPSQSHHRRPSQSHQPVRPVNPAVIPPQPFTEPTSSTLTSSFSSPPFKPFQPLPEITRRKPPTPPPKLLNLAPYGGTLWDLSHPSPDSKNKALEIIHNRDKTNIHRTHEEWRRQDDEREKAVREKREERERLISGTSTMRAPTMQTVTTLVVDPTTVQQPPPLPKKEKKSFWKKLFRPGRSDRSSQQSPAKHPAQANGHVFIPIGPQQVLPPMHGAVVPGEMSSQSNSSSSPTHHSPIHVMRPTQTPAVIPVSPGMAYRSPGHVVRQTPAPPVIPVSPGMTYRSGVIPNAVGPPVVLPSPYPHQIVRSTTPQTPPPPTAAFFSFPAPMNV